MELAPPLLARPLGLQPDPARRRPGPRFARAAVLFRVRQPGCGFRCERGDTGLKRGGVRDRPCMFSPIKASRR